MNYEVSSLNTDVCNTLNTYYFALTCLDLGKCMYVNTIIPLLAEENYDMYITIVVSIEIKSESR